MVDLILTTFDWVPEGPRGFVRDIRLRWACEEAGLAYSVRTVPFDGREADHLARTRITERPSFRKAHADQMAHFAAADESRSAAG